MRIGNLKAMAGSQKIGLGWDAEARLAVGWPGVASGKA